MVRFRNSGTIYNSSELQFFYLVQVLTTVYSKCTRFWYHTSILYNDMTRPLTTAVVYCWGSRALRCVPLCFLAILFSPLNMSAFHLTVAFGRFTVLTPVFVFGSGALAGAAYQHVRENPHEWEKTKLGLTRSTGATCATSTIDDRW